MSKQAFGDESNWKHEPHSDHFVKDKFGKGTNTRNWKKNLDPELESEEEEAKLSEETEADAEIEDTNEEIEQKKSSRGKPQLEH